MSGGTVTITGSSLTGNTAATDGGGISVTSGTALNVRNTTVAGNTATNSGGGIAVTAGSAAINVQNSTIVGNTANATTATTGGGGMGRTTATAGTVTIANSVVAGNTNAGNGPDIKTGATGNTVNVNFSAVGTSTGHTLSGTSGNIPAGTDLKLGPLANWGGASRSQSPLAGSPLINAGSNALHPGRPDHRPARGGVQPDERDRGHRGRREPGAVPPDRPVRPRRPSTVGRRPPHVHRHIRRPDRGEHRDRGVDLHQQQHRRPGDRAGRVRRAGHIRVD